MRKKSIQPTKCNSRQATEISTRTGIILTSNRERNTLCWSVLGVNLATLQSKLFHQTLISTLLRRHLEEMIEAIIDFKHRNHP